MTRSYVFEWYAKSKYGEPLIRHTTLSLQNPTGTTAIDAKNAVNLFINTNGNLKKIEIVKIKEFDENGQIGEDITPSENINIVPSGR